MSKPIVALVGRPNVGKSTLFNRILGRNLAVVHDTPGVTRDRIYADAVWEDRAFTIADTGGLDMSPEDDLIVSVREQIDVALNEADAILFLVDVVEGLTSWDVEVAAKLRKVEKTVYLVANKADSAKRAKNVVEFYSLGLGDPFPVSAAHGTGVGDLMDEVISNLPEAVELEKEESPIKIAVVGRPNVGKSSMVNMVLGEERVIVDSRPGTTRDAVNITFHRDASSFEIVDTAGMRRRSKIFDEVERSSVGKAIESIRRSDITWLVIDARQNIEHQDKRISSFIAKQGRACIIIANKWDLVDKDHRTFDEFCDELRYQAPRLDYVPILSTSALTGLRVEKLLELTQIIFAEYTTRVATPLLNRAFRFIISDYQHPVVSGRRPTLKYITQVSTEPPTFAVFTTYPEKIRDDYENYLVNRLREEFGFQGAPIKLKFLSSRSNQRAGRREKEDVTGTTSDNS